MWTTAENGRSRGDEENEKQDSETRPVVKRKVIKKMGAARRGNAWRVAE